MILETIIFILSSVLGLWVMWRESQGNTVYRTFNKFLNSKKSKGRMLDSDKKGFFYQRKFLTRCGNLFLLSIVFSIIMYYLPIMLTIQLNVAFFVGFLIGIYVAELLPAIKSITENPQDALHEVFNDGKEIIKDLSKGKKTEVKNTKVEPQDDSEVKTEEQQSQPQKSARDKLKDKGLL